MTQAVDDDLFKDSTMSFGEHLEELRGALARSLVGLVIGFLIALFFADDAVRMVTMPLEKALSRLNVKTTTKAWKHGEGDKLQPEDYLMLEKEGLVPTTMQMDVDQVIGQLTDIGVIPNPEANSGKFNIASVPKEEVPRLAKSLQGLSSGLLRSAAQKAIWESIPPARYESLKRLAAADVASDADQNEFHELLNELADSDLVKNPAFENLKKLFPEEGKRRAMERLRQLAMEAGQANERAIVKRRANRLLLATSMNEPRMAPQKRVIEVRMWEPSNVQLQSLGAQEPFLILIKAALILGLLIASPWIFIQVWNFVAAGLYPHEQNYVYTYLPFSLGLFFAGAALAFVFVFQPVLDFLFSFNVMMNITAAPRLNEWVSFVLFLPLGFGISFQLPLVMLLLERIGVMSVEKYLSTWRIAVLVIFFISMMLTPADPMSMMLMGVPLTILYFGGILMCKFMPGRSNGELRMDNGE